MSVKMIFQRFKNDSDLKDLNLDKQSFVEFNMLIKSLGFHCNFCNREGHNHLPLHLLYVHEKSRPTFGLEKMPASFR